jgi:hypothetical protein
MPAVVVGDHGYRRVADLRLAGQLGLLQIGHTHHIRAPAAIEIRLRLGRELRPFHADIGAALFAHDAGMDAGFHSRPATVAHTGSPKATWPTMPSPKKVLFRRKVRSMNWSGTTKSVGLCSSLRIRRRKPIRCAPRQAASSHKYWHENSIQRAAADGHAHVGPEKPPCGLPDYPE